MQCPRCQHDNREGRRFCAEWSIANITPIVSHGPSRLGLIPAWHNADKSPSHRAAILPEPVGVIKWIRLVGEGPGTPWRDARSGQTTTLTGGAATALRERGRERGGG